jgi:hypothetical protein
MRIIKTAGYKKAQIDVQKQKAQQINDAMQGLTGGLASGGHDKSMDYAKEVASLYQKTKNWQTAFDTIMNNHGIHQKQQALRNNVIKYVKQIMSQQTPVAQPQATQSQQPQISLSAIEKWVDSTNDRGIMAFFETIKQKPQMYKNVLVEMDKASKGDRQSLAKIKQQYANSQKQMGL